MSNSLQEEMCEGTLEWKISDFLRRIDVRKTSSFLFGTKTCILKLTKFPRRFQAGIEIERVFTSFTIGLHVSGSGKLNNFTSSTFLKSSFISRDGGEHFALFQSVPRQTLDFLCLIPPISEALIRKEMNELLPGGTLTFRLQWNDKKDRFESTDTAEQETQTSQDPYPGKSFEKLSKDIGSLYERQTETDCVLRVGDEQIQVHRVVISARSEVFAAMFRHDTSENRRSVVDIPDVDAVVLSDIVHYMYSGQVRGLSTSSAVEMCIAADKYGIVEMKHLCLDFLVRNITMENVADAAVLAHIYDEDSALENVVIQFIKANSKDIMDNDSFKTFSKDHPSIAAKYLHYAFISSSDRETK